ncbi:MAG: DUF3854 domain-containing protein [Phormidesmis sp.]
MSVTPKHYDELKASGISDEIIDRYFYSTDGTAARDWLIEPAVDKLGAHSSQYVTASYKRLLDASEHVMLGGWVCSANGQIKPDSPRTDADGKLIKYESIREKPYRGAHVSLMTPVGEPIKAADGSRLIGITEGGKKGGALNTLGCEALAFGGTDMGSYTEGLAAPDLIPVLAELAKEGCTFAIAYDQDSKKKTRRGVAGSLARLADLLIQQGCSVLVPVWSPKDGKGIDDVLVKKGADFVRSAIATADTFKAWKASLPKSWFRPARPAGYSTELKRIEALHKAFNAKPTADITLNQRYLGKGTLPLAGTVMLVDSAMGTGKTSSYLAGIMEAWRQLHPDAIAISSAYRNILLRQSGAALGFTHWLDTDGDPSLAKFKSIAACPDSLAKLACQKIPAGSLILIDEVVAWLRYIFTSDTLKNGADRVAAFNAVRTLFDKVIDGGGYIIGLEANIPQWALDCLRDLLPAGTPLKLTRNEFKLKSEQKVFVYDSLKAFKEQQQKMVLEGVRIIAASDSATQVDLQYRPMFNTEKDFHISAKNSSEDEAQSFASDPQAWLVARGIIRFLSYSPTIGAGVSIVDVNGEYYWFDAKSGIFTHLTSADAAQQLARYRRDVPIHIYCQEKANGIGDGNLEIFCPAKLQARWRDDAKYCHRLVEMATYLNKGSTENLVKTLERSLKGEFAEVAMIDKWRSVVTAVDNFDKLHLQKNLIDRLKADGYEIEWADAEATPEKKAEFKELKEQAESAEGAEFSAVEVPDTMSPDEARSILGTHGHSRDETLQAKKCLYQFEFPGCDWDNGEFCADWLVKNKGKKLSQLRSEWASRNPEQAKAIDRWHLKGKLKQAYNLNTGVSMADVSQFSPEADVFARAGLPEAIDAIGCDPYDNEHPEVVRVAKWVENHQPLLKQVFRMKFEEERSPVDLFNSLARKIGYQPKAEKKKGKKGQQDREYILSDFTNPDRGHMLKSLSDKFVAKLEQKGETLNGESLNSKPDWGVDAKTLQARVEAQQVTSIKQESLIDSDGDWEPIGDDWQAIAPEPMPAPKIKATLPAQPLAKPVEADKALYPTEIIGDWLAYGFQNDLCEATTYQELIDAKEKTPENTRRASMNLWKEDGRYDALIAKTERLNRLIESVSV